MEENDLAYFLKNQRDITRSTISVIEGIRRINIGGRFENKKKARPWCNLSVEQLPRDRFSNGS